MLQVVHSHLNELNILSCGFEKVELKWLPEFTKLTFEGWISFQDPLSFGSIPMLNAVSLSNACLSWHKMVVLSKFLSSISVQDLTLNFQSEKIWVQPEGAKGLVSVFHKLCSVSLIDLPEGCDLTWTMFILEAAPSLKLALRTNMCNIAKSQTLVPPTLLYVMQVWDHVCTMVTDEERRRRYSYSKKKGVEWKATDSKHQSLASFTIFNFQTEDYSIY
ncbi:hypothetical protein PR202_ga03357 [Eleusine coracana subsp. coracana]|uniref:Uncharacterized protein n=1 Tax=Eleusine coracana subsp. coracana TaxID=191504 RepID=A0AAV5BN80_ELECO|nr:hypothetical protein PR202_ga03357 [Eleusine coracana subsp. coracana]